MQKRLLALALLLTTFPFAQGFQKLSPKETGIDFVNTIIEDDTINGLSYLYLYNGGGVAIGDINNDGLEDIYLTGNQVDDKLYLNQGDLKFKDVTKKYFKNQRFDFHTGVTMVDINDDGWLDIYVSCAGPDYEGENRRNKLFINQDGKRFEDQAKKYGLDDSLNTTQAAFFDADGDGDLDCYLLNHVFLRQNAQEKFKLNEPTKITGNDKLYINNNGVFEDKTVESRIESTGYGLGLVVTDVNNDNWPDIYVTNDFDYPDKLFLNKGDGKFREVIKQNTMHIPLYAMGADAGDINNDGWMDLMVVDMASADHVRSKKNMGGMSSKNFWNLVHNNKHYQYMFNTLQLNLGGQFTDIALMSGVSKTDWSWATLFADFNNNGWQDLYVANGYIRDIRDNDFKIKYESEIKNSDQYYSFEEMSKMIPRSKLRDFIFMNNGNLTYEDASIDMGILEKENVNGAVYADLDNDGDLDMVCNEIDALSFVRKNLGAEKNNYVQFDLPSKIDDFSTLNCKMKLEAGGAIFYREFQPTRGFQSAVTQRVHFGIGAERVVEKLTIKLIGGAEYQYTGKISTNQINQLNETDFKMAIRVDEDNQAVKLKKTKRLGIDIEHTELDHDDFKEEVLLPHKMSQLGPEILVADVNGDSLDDFYLTGARGMTGGLFIQTSQGAFNRSEEKIWEQSFHNEEVGGVFFDADNDGDLDLYIVSGGNEAPHKHGIFQDHLYINNGKGIFSDGSGRLPFLPISGKKVLAKDINGDGWDDLLVFGRQVPKAYPSPESSYILMNKNGTFVEETTQFTNEFESLGMVTDAIFVDYDNDKQDELIIVGEWMPITVFDWKQDKLVNVTKEVGLENTTGWWSTIELYSGQDGAFHFVCGNIGENNKFHPSEKKPFHIYMADFDENGTNDIVLAKKQEDILYPVRGRQCSSEQMPFILDKFPSYDEFACASVEKIYTPEKLEQALHIKAQNFSNSQLSIVNGNFKLNRLPSIYQTGPINSVIIEDFNSDGLLDMVSLGNKFEAEVETVRYDGNPGFFSDGKDKLNNPQSLNHMKNIKDAALIKVQGENYILIGVNNNRIDLMKIE